MINNSKNKRLKKLINSKLLYTLPLAGIGLIGTQQTTNAMFNPPKILQLLNILMMHLLLALVMAHYPQRLLPQLHRD